MSKSKLKKEYVLKSNNLVLKDPNSFEKFSFNVKFTLENSKDLECLERFKNVLYFCLRKSAIGDSNPILYDKFSIEEIDQ
jgi:hypothetical protein